MRRLQWGLALLVATAGCDGCGDADDGETKGAEAPLPSPDRWTMGAGRPDGIALPSVCRTPDPPLATVLDRPVRIEATPRAYAVLVRDGGYDPVAGRASWKAHAAGVLTMLHGTSPLELTVPAQGPVATSLWRDQWIAAVAADVPSPPQSRLVQPGGPPADLRCRAEGCALLTAETPSILWRGRPGDAWRSTTVGKEGLRILDWGDDVEVATADDLRVYITRVTETGLAKEATLSAPDGVFDVAPGPAALARIADLDPRGCSDEAGGVLLVTPGKTWRLRSPLAPLDARLVRLEENAWLAVWMSPRRCGSRFLHQVYAAVVHATRGLLAPPMAVGRADEFAVAAEGTTVGLWLSVEDGDHQATVTYVAARCDVATPAEMR